MKIQVNNYLPIVDLGKNENKTIFLSSTARSGSTFFANLLNYDKNYRIIFEPLSEENVPEAKVISFPRYLNKYNSNSIYKTFFKNVITGNISNSWIDRENASGIYTKRLVKEVRSNRLLPWITHNFPEIKVILLLRHPISVINSWQEMKFEDGFKLKELILNDKQFIETLSKTILHEYKKENDSFILSLYYWCMCNSYPLNNCNSNSLLKVKYEDIVSKNQTVMNEVYRTIGIDISKAPSMVFDKSSSSSDYKKEDPSARLNGLKQSVGKDRLVKAQSIMQMFEMQELYNLNLEI